MIRDKKLDKEEVMEFFRNIKVPCEDGRIETFRSDTFKGCTLDCPLNVLQKTGDAQLSVEQNICIFLKKLIESRSCFMCGGAATTKVCEFCNNSRSMPAWRYLMLEHVAKKNKANIKI